MQRVLRPPPHTPDVNRVTGDEGQPSRPQRPPAAHFEAAPEAGGWGSDTPHASVSAIGFKTSLDSAPAKEGA